MITIIEGNGIYKTKIRTDKAVHLPPPVLNGIGAGPGDMMYMTVFENRILMSAETAHCQICGNDVSILPMLFNDGKLCYSCNRLAVRHYLQKLERDNAAEGEDTKEA